VAGLRYNVSGVATNVYEPSVGIRFKSQAMFVRPFMAFHAGMLITQLGRITISQWFESQPQVVNSASYQNSGTLATRPFGSIGIGTVVPMGENFALLAEAQFTFVAGTGQILMPFTLTGQFQL